MPAIEAEEVAQLLRHIASGEVAAQCSGRSWSDVYCGGFTFSADGWQLRIFNDCNEVDYVETAIAPDGRRTEFEEWKGASGVVIDPIDCLTGGEIERLHDVLEELPASV